MNKKELLKSTAHRPFPLPHAPWVMQQTWKDLLFLHFKIPYDILRQLVPKELELDTFEGETWISISPFKMRNVKFRWLPPVPTAHNFLELNLRTYVKLNERPGIYFFSLDTSSTLSAIGARMAFLPYFRAKMKVGYKDRFHYYSKRIISSKTPAILEVSYKPISSPFLSEKGSLNEWLVERYCLFQKALLGKVIEIDIHHLPWKLQKAEAEVSVNTLTQPFGFSIPDQQPVLHFASLTEVLVWPMKIITPEDKFSP